VKKLLKKFKELLWPVVKVVKLVLADWGEEVEAVLPVFLPQEQEV
jgi:hypothetical protein